MAVAGVVHVDGVAGVGGQLAKRALAPPHSLRQPAAGPAPSQGEGAVVGVAHHQGVGAGDVPWGRRDVRWERNPTDTH